MWNTPVFRGFWVWPMPSKNNSKARLSTADLKDMPCSSEVLGRAIRERTSSPSEVVSEGHVVLWVHAVHKLVPFLHPRRLAQELCSSQVSHQTCFDSVNCRFVFGQGLVRAMNWCWGGCRLPSAPHGDSKARGTWRSTSHCQQGTLCLSD